MKRMTIIPIALAALTLYASPAMAESVTAKQAVTALADIHLSAAAVNACGRGTPKARKAVVDKVWPRVQTVSDLFRKAFGSAIPTEFKAKHTETCSSLIKYENDLEFKVYKAERWAKSLPAPTASQ